MDQTYIVTVTFSVPCLLFWLLGMKFFLNGKTKVYKTLLVPSKGRKINALSIFIFFSSGLFYV